MKAIILAAGKGTRLGKLTEDRPKCMLEFGNELIIERQFRILKCCGFRPEDVLIVAGYKKEKIESLGLCDIIYNEKYYGTDNSYSLYLALKQIEEDVLVLDGDLIFEKEAVKSLLASEGSTLLAIKSEGEYGATGIEMNSGSGYVTAIGKHISSDVIYTGMMKICWEHLPDMKRALSISGMEKTWYTVPLNQILRDVHVQCIFCPSKICGINSYFEYFEAKRIFGIENFSIMVTGASGFLGKKICHVLKRNYRVEEVKGPHSDLPMETLDLCDANRVEAYLELKHPNIVIHTANIADPDQCEKDKETAWQTNVVTTKILTEVCSRRNIKLIYISTDYVFDGESEEPYGHHAERHPKNYYGETKCQAEDIVSHYDNSLIIRIPIIYGYNDETDKLTFPIRVLDKLRCGEKLKLDNRQIRYPVLIDEVAIAISEALGEIGIIHITSRMPVTKYSWAKIIAKEFGCDETLITADDQSSLANRPPHVCLEVDRGGQRFCCFQCRYGNSDTEKAKGMCV
ncbi:MAG: sugar nucleotide-binding protein [Clostridium sp.]|nr:sugar nucleotide-binding protein [Bacteroides sp.]MCM1563592.1 sugar nucleotide-binding protein [Clostridium sp.]